MLPLWPLYNWQYKELSMSHDQKVIASLSPMEKCPTSIKELFLMPKFDNKSSSVTRDKEICQSHVIEVIASLPPEAEHPMQPFE